MSSSITSINASTPPSSATSSTTTSASPGQTLTQQDFLEIMVAQFTQQDPLATSDGSGGSSGTSDYVSQLISMTNLTTMQTMSSQLTTTASQQATQLAASLTGDTVEVTDANNNPVTGVVQSSSTSGSNVYLTINGQQYSAANLVSIEQTAAQSIAAAGTTTAATTP